MTQPERLESLRRQLERQLRFLDREIRAAKVDGFCNTLATARVEAELEAALGLVKQLNEVT